MTKTILLLTRPGDQIVARDGALARRGDRHPVQDGQDHHRDLPPWDVDDPARTGHCASLGARRPDGLTPHHAPAARTPAPPRRFGACGVMSTPTKLHARAASSIYTPATAAARTEGKVTMRLTPDEAAAWRQGQRDTGGLAGLARWLLAQRDTLEK